MPVNKSAYYRYLLIDKCISNKFKPFPNKEEMMQYIKDKSGQNISLRQLEYDLSEMKNSESLGFYAPIEYHKTQKGYYYSKSDFTLGQLITLNKEDFNSLEMAIEILDTYKEIDIFKNFKNAIEKINSEFTVSKNFSNIEVEKILQPEKNINSLGLEWLNILVSYIKEKSCVELNYRKFSEEEKIYELSPYILKEFDNRWYLIAMDNNEKTIKAFGLERIMKVERSDKTYLDNGFNSFEHFKNVFGISTKANSNVETVCLEFNSFVSNFIKTKPIHFSQKIIKEDADKVVFQIEVVPTIELKNFILSWGSNCKVLSPESLKTQICEEMEKSLEQYKLV